MNAHYLLAFNVMLVGSDATLLHVALARKDHMAANAPHACVEMVFCQQRTKTEWHLL